MAGTVIAICHPPGIGYYRRLIVYQPVGRQPTALMLP